MIKTRVVNLKYEPYDIYIGIDTSEEYCKIAYNRIKATKEEDKDD